LVPGWRQACLWLLAVWAFFIVSCGASAQAVRPHSARLSCGHAQVLSECALFGRSCGRADLRLCSGRESFHRGRTAPSLDGASRHPHLTRNGQEQPVGDHNNDSSCCQTRCAPTSPLTACA
jgi:hypothetical protein